MENEKVYNLVEKLYTEMQKGFEKVDARFEQVDARFEKIDNRLDNMDNRVSGLEKEIRKTNLIIEHDIKPKIEVLFDGHQQISDRLSRIEAEVTRYDEFILKKIT